MWPFTRREERKAVATSLDLWREIYGGRESRAGAEVNWKTAVEVAAVLACVRVIANGIAQVPCRLYRAQGGGREAAQDHPLYDVLHRKPNPWMTSFEYRETVAWHVILTGNSVSLVNRVGRAREVRELIPLEPRNVQITDKDGRPVYRVTFNGATEEVPPDAVWHLRGPSWNGWIGLDAVKLARDAIGLTIATERSQADFHKNGGKTSGLYSVDEKLSPEKYALLRKWFEEEMSQGGAYRPMILDNGAKYTPVSMTGVDAQHIETRKHQIEEVCRAFGVLPIMVGHADKTATYASAEQMFLAHVVHTLSPWYERIEQSADVQLLSDEERRAGLYVKFLPNGLMRGASRDRAEFYKAALGTTQQPGWMTVDEVRGLEEMNPLGGDAASLTPLITRETEPNAPD